jgi:hypothetical protein
MDHTGPIELVELPRRSRQTDFYSIFKRLNISTKAGKAEEEQDMLNQIVKSFTMLMLVVGLAFAATVVTANAQLTSTHVIADIPFDFVVGKATLPAGKYTVTSATSAGDALRITSRDNDSSAIRLCSAAMDKSEKRKARMVFHRYGQQYFLAEVWSGDNYGRLVFESKQERNLRRELEMIASKSDSPTESYQIVEVVALAR